MNISSFIKTNQASQTYNKGLQEYMLGIYNYMTTALILSAVIAFFSAKLGITKAIFSSPLGLIVSLAPLGIAIYLSARFHKMTTSSVTKTFFTYAAIMGLSLSTLFYSFSAATIIQAFCVSAATFAGASIYGYVTKKDMTSMASYMFMAIWGILIASIINIFLKSGSLSYMLSIVSVLLFTAITAYDTQKLRTLYYARNLMSEQEHKKLAIFGAMQLYIDFVALFINILNLIGNRNR